MKTIELIKPGDFVEIKNEYTNSFYLCIAPNIFATDNKGWRAFIEDNDIIQILRPNLGFDIHYYFTALKNRDYGSLMFDVIYSKCKEYTIAELEEKLNLPSGTLRIKK